MAVLAQFWVQSVKKQVVSQNELAREVILQPVGGAQGKVNANINWSKYTPSGEIRLVITAEPAGLWFEERLGKDIAITFDDPEDAGFQS